ncbi:Hypothetical predicted protein [Mytilus galloprovincialis]|uniref:Novel STAND NTPase 3 domain-containing protein n=1 Tax=Mytilus galloprovincialis TaxID=29158 RepID=A0A8B6FB69_MYTGA|nr:Hypothetical predicted protein [Mytilus galloprovincialis]
MFPTLTVFTASDNNCITIPVFIPDISVIITGKEERSIKEQKILKKEDAQEEVIPGIIREQIKNQIEDWEKNDKMFVCTRASDYVIECLKKKNCVTLTAPSGVGKSFISRHTALIFQKEGYNIIPVYSPQSISDYFQPGRQTVFIIDDFCGNYIANQVQILSWRELLPVVNRIIADKSCKIIVSCRLQVYKDDGFNILLPFKSCECNLISDNLRLTPEEKTNILKSYIDTSKVDIGEICQTSDFFPLLCYLYHAKNCSDVIEFFRNPFRVYKNELDNLSMFGEEGNYKMCSLALCVLFDNQLEEEWFQGKVTDKQRYLIKDINANCDLNICSKKKLKHALDSLDGTFVRKRNGIYRAVHNKLFDFLAHYVGHKMIKCLINHGDSHLVHERCIWQKSQDHKNRNIDFIIEIHEDYLESYIKRFIKDWSAGNVVAVFGGYNFRVSSFRQQLLQYLIHLDNSEQIELANTKDTLLPMENCGSGSTPLICTCNDGYADMVQWILNNDVDVDLSRTDGNTALILACRQGHVEIVRLLLQKNPIIDLCNQNEIEALNWACYKGYTSIVNLLLQKNPNVDLCNLNGITALNWACYKGYDIIVNMLLQKNPDVDLCSIDGRSPLYMASQRGHTNIVRLLLEKNANVNLCTSDGRSPLHISSQNRHTDIVRLLLENNSNVDLCTNNGKTALTLACGKGYPAIVNMLLDKNSNFDVCVRDGCSPLYMASQNGKQMIECFIDHGDSSFIHQRFIWQISPNDKNSNIDFFIEIPDEYLESYLKRFIKDWSAGNVIVVFESSNMNVSLFRKQLLQYLIQLDKSEQVALANTKDTVFPKHLVGLNNTPLISSCNQGYTDVVQWILSNDVRVDECRDDKVTGLIMACQEGHVDIVRLLLQQNPKVDLCDMKGITALLWACFKGYADIVSILLERNSSVDLFSSDGRSPVYMASQKGHTDIVRLLLDKNPNVNLCSSYGRSPLCISSQQGHTDIVRLLLDKNPNVNLCDSDKCSPLSMASLNGHTDIIRLLLEKNPNVDLCTRYGKTALNLACFNGYTAIVNMLLDKNPNVDLCDSNGRSPLYTASQKGYTDIVRLLLSKNSNVHLGSRDGHRPLYVASQKGYTAIVRMLLDINPNADLCDNDGCSPLSKACLNGYTDIVRLLLDKNPNVDLCDSDGCSPLYMASQNGHTDIVTLLLEHNPNVDLCGNHCLTPLIHLCKRDDPSVVALLLRHKPAINVQSSLGGNALHFSVMNGNIEITQLLVQNNADCNVCVHSKQTVTDAMKTLSPPVLDTFKQKMFVTFLKDALSNVAKYVSKKSEDYTFDVWSGSSPLHIACFVGTIDIVDCLLGHNANINMTKEDGTTPLFYACELGHEDIVRLLLNKGVDIEILRLDRKSALNIATDNGHKTIVAMITKHMKSQ